MSFPYLVTMVTCRWYMESPEENMRYTESRETEDVTHLNRT